jgi:hypothetical protein
MKRTKMIVFILFSILLNRSMTLANPFEGLPNELIQMILSQDLSLSDLAQVSLVNKELRGNVSDVVKQNLNKVYKEIREPDQKQSYLELTEEEKIQFKKDLRNLRDVKKIEQISLLEGSEIQELLNRKEVLISYFLRKIKDQNLKAFKQWISQKARPFDSNRVYIASFLAVYMVNYSAARSAVWCAARDAAEDVVWNAAESVPWKVASNAASSAAEEAAWNAALKAASNAARDTTSKFARNAASKFAWNTAWGAAWNAALNPTKQALSKSGLSNSTEIGKTAYGISELLVLHWLEEHGSRYVIDVIEVAYNVLAQSIEIENMKEVMGHKLKDEKYSNNLFIQSLNAFLDQVEDLKGLAVKEDL